MSPSKKIYINNAYQHKEQKIYFLKCYLKEDFKHNIQKSADFSHSRYELLQLIDPH